MAKLHIADGLSLPLDATTQAIGIVAKRRVGKSYTARRFAEQLLKAGQQVVIVDPKGDWWGIRSSADGKSAGYPVVILGGEHGDVPLEKGAGEIIAKMVVEERVSCLLDLSHFRKSEVAVFMADFLETLYRLKAKESLRTALMLVVDEADAIFPQKPNPGEERMLGAGEDIVRRGGQRGVGCMMITQRTAVLNKNVLTQCEMLVALRTISPQDLKAMQAWIDVHGTIEERDMLMASLPSLPQGDAWFWSPGWPTADGIFKRVHVSAIETFDSGATPKSGEKRVEPKTLADVDIPALQKHIASTIERAKADDPKALRAEIASLKKQLAAAPSKERVIEKTVVDERATARAVAAAVKPYQAKLSLIQQRLFPLTKALGATVEKLEAVVAETSNPEAAPDAAVHVPFSRPERPPVAVSRSTVTSTPRAPVVHQPVDGISVGQQKIINALAELEAIGISQATRLQLGMYASYNLTGGSGAQHIADLVSAGLVEMPEKGVVRLTDRGRGAASAVDVPQTRVELHERVMKKITEGQRKILGYLLEIYPEAISRKELGEATNYNLTGGSGAQHVADLITVGAVRIPSGGRVVASDLLFPEGLS